MLPSLCATATFYRDHDGFGGCWYAYPTEPAPPFAPHLQHRQVDGTLEFPDPGVPLWAPENLQGFLALKTSPSGGGFYVHAGMLDPDDASPSEETSPRGIYALRFDEAGSILWTVRVDDIDGPKVWAGSHDHAMSPDGTLLTSWIDLSAGTPRCLAQTIADDGTVLGPSGGMPWEDVACEEVAAAWPLPDSEGFTLVWQHHEDFQLTGLRAMRWDWSLTPLWAKAIEAYCGDLSWSSAVTDGDSGALVLLGAEIGGIRTVGILRILRDGTLGFD